MADAEVGEQERDRFRGHGRAAVGADGQPPAADALLGAGSGDELPCTSCSFLHDHYVVKAAFMDWPNLTLTGTLNAQLKWTSLRHCHVTRPHASAVTTAITAMREMSMYRRYASRRPDWSRLAVVTATATRRNAGRYR